MARRALSLLALALAAVALGACGDQEFDLEADETADVRTGATIFKNKCAGCHTIEAVGAEGSAVNVRDRERIDGPNFNTRAEEVDQVLYAIRNGGYSGAIMPENIVTGREARQVAEFVAKYSAQSAASTGADGS
ncbi:MAG: c-type cytochrome [Actinomycetota bacterium]|jgi:mono/diheme cytochrome c family protein|nr:c-type cytochrome [Actinomycetota bacterium]